MRAGAFSRNPERPLRRILTSVFGDGHGRIPRGTLTGNLMHPAASSSLRQVGVISCRNHASVAAGDSHPMSTMAVKSLGGQHLLAPLRSIYRPDPVLQLGADWLFAIYDLASVTSNELGFPNSYRCLRIAHVKFRAPLLAETAAGQQRNAENVLEYLHRRLLCRLLRGFALAPRLPQAQQTCECRK
jgi:hypothetical protein